MGRRNLLAGALLLAVGIGYGLAAGQLPDRTLPDTPGPAFFPWLIAIGLTVLSTSLVLRSLIAPLVRSGASPDYRMPRRGWLALGSFAAYLLLLPYAGFVLASVPFCGSLVVLYGERRRLIVVAGAVLVPLALFVVFGAGFQVLLPRGSWW